MGERSIEIVIPVSSPPVGLHVGYVVSPSFIQLTIPDLETHFPSCGLPYRYIRDTRVLLTSTDGAKVIPMTENHHAEARVESIRLRRMMGSGLITDSFGEARCVPLRILSE